MICEPCKVQRHGRCTGGTWCDCQHVEGKLVIQEKDCQHYRTDFDNPDTWPCPTCGKEFVDPPVETSDGKLSGMSSLQGDNGTDEVSYSEI